MSQQWCSIQPPWRLRVIMAERGMFATTDIVRRLAEGGTVPSRSQAHRLVARHSCTAEPARAVHAVPHPGRHPRRADRVPRSAVCILQVTIRGESGLVFAVRS